MQTSIQADRGQINTVKQIPKWIVRECCSDCGGEEYPFPADGWAIVHAFAMQGWSVFRDGDCVRVFFCGAQEGTA